MISVVESTMNDNDVDGSSSTLPSAINFLSKYNFELPLAITALTESNHMAPLGQSYQPGMYDVVCGRGKGSYNRPGNKRFRSLVATFIPGYIKARSKVDKSMVLNSIIDTLRSFTNPDTGSSAQFVKYTKSTGWVLIGDEHAREKVGHAIREAITAQESSTDNDASFPALSSLPSPSPIPSVYQEVQPVSTSLYSPCDDILTISQQKLFLNHLRTVRQRSSLTSLEMQAAVDTFLLGV